MQPQELLDRCEYTIKYQMQEIDRLRAELERRDDELKLLLEWINGDADALTTLQRTYMDPKISTSDRIKAAGAAIAYERPKLSVQLRVGPAVLGWSTGRVFPRRENRRTNPIGPMLRERFPPTPIRVEAIPLLLPLAAAHDPLFHRRGIPRQGDGE
jgi:hypothetical protein